MCICIQHMYIFPNQLYSLGNTQLKVKIFKNKIYEYVSLLNKVFSGNTMHGVQTNLEPRTKLLCHSKIIFQTFFVRLTNQNFVVDWTWFRILEVVSLFSYFYSDMWLRVLRSVIKKILVTKKWCFCERPISNIKFLNNK